MDDSTLVLFDPPRLLEQHHVHSKTSGSAIDRDQYGHRCCFGCFELPYTVHTCILHIAGIYTDRVRRMGVPVISPLLHYYNSCGIHPVSAENDPLRLQ